MTRSPHMRRDSLLGHAAEPPRQKDLLATSVGSRKSPPCTSLRFPSLSDAAELANRASPTPPSGPANPFAASPRTSLVANIPDALLSRFVTEPADVRGWAKREPTVRMRRGRVVLVGAEEAGKTSLMKCFAKTPLFFKSLPDVGTTIGVESQWHRARAQNGEFVDVEVVDFAGQEVYHSHSLFLTSRSVALFVWDMSACEQTYDDFGINPADERRLKQWADILQARCPGAPVYIVGTHKDLLRDQSPQSVRVILRRVVGIFRKHVQSYGLPEQASSISLQQAFCVSCRDRSVVCEEEEGGPGSIKELFQYICDECHRLACIDAHTVPRGVVEICATLRQMQADGTLVLPIRDFNGLARQAFRRPSSGLSLTSHDQQWVTRALHDWGVLYLFDKQGPGRQDCVFLQPLWLPKMVSSLFSYVHLMTAPPHERANMRGLLIDAAECQRLEPTGLILEGVLDERLGPAIFGGVLRSIGREPTKENCDLCFLMLGHLDIAFRNTGPAVQGPLAGALEPTAGQQWYVPSLLPRAVPADLCVHVARLARRRGACRSVLLRPFPKELMQMLHCRVEQLLVRGVQVTAPVATGSVHSAAARRVTCRWSDGWWGGGGGGRGSDVGGGPLRALCVADLSSDPEQAAGGHLNVWALGPEDNQADRLTAAELADMFVHAVRELLHKYPGVVMEEEEFAADDGAELETETFDALRALLSGDELLFLLRSLGVDLTEPQRSQLPATTGDESNFRVSLLLDRLIRAELGRDPSLSQFV